MARLSSISLLAILLLAGACGGGGSSDGSPVIVTPPVAVKPGQIDRSFGVNGVASVAATSLGMQDSTGSHTTQDAAGRIWSTGSVRSDPNAALETLVVRFLPNGVLDSSLQGTGWLRSTGGPASAGTRIDMSSTGTTVVEARYDACCTSPSDFAGRRLSASGTPDPAYGNGGIASIDLAIRDVVFDGSGGLVAVGMAGNRPAVRRLDATGTPDTAFAANATAALDCGGTSQAYFIGPKAARLSTGKYLVAFSIEDSPYTLDRLCVMRLNSDGTLDISYADQGKLQLTNFKYVYSRPLAVFPKADGSALIPTMASVPPYPSRDPCAPGYGHPGLVWLTPGGGLDASLPSEVPQLFQVSATAMQTDGRILIAGLRNGTCGPDWQNPVLLRLTAQGAPDTGFGSTGDGFAPLVADGLPMAVNHILPGSDGAIYVTGGLRQTPGAGVYRLAVMKLAS